MKRSATCFLLFFLLPLVLGATQVIHVAGNGNDTWSGEFAEPLTDGSDGPLATLAAAREKVRDRIADRSRSREEIIVSIRGGRYALSRTLHLGPEDSGIPSAPVTWQAYPGEEVLLDGGSRISGFERLDRAEVETAVPEDVHDRVFVANLRDAGIPFPETLERRTRYEVGRPSPLQVYYEGELMTLARYPNEGWVRIADVPQLEGEPIREGHHADRRDGETPTGRHFGLISYLGFRPLGWSSPGTAWMHGYWTWDWADSTQRIEDIDTENRVIRVAAPHHRYGYTDDQRYYYFNIPEELDSPGEWYLDRETGNLFFWPPDNGLKGEVVVSRFAETMITVEEGSHIRIRGLDFAYGRGAAVHVVDSEHVTVEDARFHCMGGRPVTVAGGSYCGVENSTFSCLSTGAVFLDGGDRATLEPANHFVVNNHIQDFSKLYRTIHPAIRLHGVGHRAAHNLIHNAPHMGLYFRGNDHLIEYNEIHDIAKETGDVGAIYTGRDYTARGTVIRYNYLHDLHGPGLHGVRGVYLDDFTSGIDVFGNVFYRAGRAAFIGGGRNNKIQNNLFIECEPSIQVDGRGLSWAVHHFDEDHPQYASTLRDHYAAANVSIPPYSIRYPELLGLYDDEVRVPKDNLVENNLSFGGIFLDLYDGIDLSVVSVRNNLVADPLVLRMTDKSDQEPDYAVYSIEDARAGEILAGNLVRELDTLPYAVENGRIRLDIQALPKGTGFIPIPFEKIGLQKTVSRPRP